MDIALFIFKVFLASLALSIAIKYGAPFLNVSPTSSNALIAVILPPITVAIALLVQRQLSNPKDPTQKNEL